MVWYGLSLSVRHGLSGLLVVWSRLVGKVWFKSVYQTAFTFLCGISLHYLS